MNDILRIFKVLTTKVGGLLWSALERAVDVAKWLTHLPPRILVPTAVMLTCLTGLVGMGFIRSWRRASTLRREYRGAKSELRGAKTGLLEEDRSRAVSLVILIVGISLAALLAYLVFGVLTRPPEEPPMLKG